MRRVFPRDFFSFLFFFTIGLFGDCFCPRFLLPGHFKMGLLFVFQVSFSSESPLFSPGLCPFPPLRKGLGRDVVPFPLSVCIPQKDLPRFLRSFSASLFPGKGFLNNIEAKFRAAANVDPFFFPLI